MRLRDRFPDCGKRLRRFERCRVAPGRHAASTPCGARVRSNRAAFRWPKTRDVMETPGGRQRIVGRRGMAHDIFGQQISGLGIGLRGLQVDRAKHRRGIADRVPASNPPAARIRLGDNGRESGEGKTGLPAKRAQYPQAVLLQSNSSRSQPRRAAKEPAACSRHEPVNANGRWRAKHRQLKQNAPR